MRRIRVAVILLLLARAASAVPAPPVRASEDAAGFRLDNGIVALRISRKTAEIASILYRHGGVETEMGKAGDALYFDFNGGPTDIPADVAAKRPRAGYQRLSDTAPSFTLNQAGPDRAEVTITGGPTLWFPFRAEIHYALFRGASGFYAWVVYRHEAADPAASLGQTRFVVKGPPGDRLYTHHIVDDRRKAPFPTSPVVKQVMDATFLLRDGTVYTKYDNTAFMADHHLHGMAGHGVGIWIVTPSNEYVNGGPVKQELTVHVDNVLLCMLEGGHFGSGSLEFEKGERWSKTYGPFFVYLNSGPSVDAMYADAKRRASMERKAWPYRWAAGPDYPVRRGTITGKLRLTDGHSVAGAWAILAAPGGDWPLQGKGYIYWARADARGAFTIPKVRPGRYTLYAYGADQFEQFQRDTVTVRADGVTDLGVLSWIPVTHGRRIFQIGVADRSTREFRNGDDVRHWGNYRRYPVDFPHDVTFVVGKSREKEDWNFAQWTWNSEKPYWTIRFPMKGAQSGKATLTIGFASSQPARGRVTNLEVKVNGQLVTVLHQPKSGTAGYRSGGQDSDYRFSYVTFEARLLHAGWNEITLDHKEARPFPREGAEEAGMPGHVMYDAIRLEVVP